MRNVFAISMAVAGVLFTASVQSFGVRNPTSVFSVTSCKKSEFESDPFEQKVAKNAQVRSIVPSCPSRPSREPCRADSQTFHRR